jgi:lipopolysaccharide export system protein LptC
MVVVDIQDRASRVRAGLGPARPGHAFDADPVILRRARRRFAVHVAKYLLPLFAMILLSSIALWPELSRSIENGRVTWRRLTTIRSEAGQMTRPRYHGVDGRNRPYTLSADAAVRAGPNRLNLRVPIGDATLENGTWMLLRARQGVFMEHVNELDLEHSVILYRQDGTILRTETATMNLKQGAAASNDYTHAEGPFGTLDAQGFMLVDKGNVIQFFGPARLVLNGAH